ncbi:CHAP domain-containing protein [Paenibacillus pabuli]|uniref:CHAP domain-containing protein n=1 Tax=Paenibacillus pabuli TaxID=1472 RepID=UPI000AEEE9E4|nr:CHAP domain-containing protein [Paenibacillus pabuli]MEC0129146.1 CHAP domain-containing protein [Paenibacillus pabuli]
MISEKKLKRVELVRALVLETLHTTENTSKKEEALVNLFGVSSFAILLAIRREQNSEIAAIAGLLHGFYYYKTGIKYFPGPNSADTVRPILRSTQIFTDEELSVILRSIFYQKDKHRVHGPYEEIIKDAILIERYVQNPGDHFSKVEIYRLQKGFVELGIPIEQVEVKCKINRRTINKGTEDRRLRLAEIAEALAIQEVMGISEDENFRQICKYWPDSDIYKVLEANWCAAFVYHCCMKAGIILPIRYPNHSYRLAGVGAWLDWAKLPETNFLYQDGYHGFIPKRGDIVIFDKLLSDNSHDHIGIVLACEGNQLLVAEGNKDNENFSSVRYKDRGHCIYGYMRIDDSYQFHFDGEYMPILSK